MYNILCSKIENLITINDELKKIIDENSKVSILPWSFATELLDLDGFFKKGEKRYNKYVSILKAIGIKEKNIKVLDCYKQSNDSIKKDINNSDVLLFTGGNPEMLYSKVVQSKECLYEIKNYKGIIIGSSAGAVLQLKRYFITAKNNYYKNFAFYDGFGNIDDSFYLDVHTIKNKKYLEKLQKVANETGKIVYAMTDSGIIIYKRDTKKFNKYGEVIIFEAQNISS